MTAWYNENDDFTADWLEKIIAAGLIAPGVVDRRSIRDVRASDLDGFTQCHFFAGIGGWSYALRLAEFPDTRPVWTGSCPCQPFSTAGQLERFADERHLWPTWVRLIQERRPAIVFGEQVASATEWLRLVRGDLEALGYAVGAVPIEAASAGADHLRDRFWFVANGGHGAGAPGEPGTGRKAQGAGKEDDNPPERDCVVADAAGDFERRQRQPSESGKPQVPARGLCSGGDMGLANGSGREPGQQAAAPARRGHSAFATSSDLEWVVGADGKARRVKPGIRLLAHGIPNRVGLLRGFGNAIDPRPAAAFIAAADEVISAHAE